MPFPVIERLGLEFEAAERAVKAVAAAQTTMQAALSVQGATIGDQLTAAPAASRKLADILQRCTLSLDSLQTRAATAITQTTADVEALDSAGLLGSEVVGGGS